MNTKVFVYGTLMEGMSNHAFLKDYPMLCEAEVEGYEMYLLGSYPGVVKGNGKIKGEVYEISEDTLKAIDELEGEGDLYIKEQVITTTGKSVLLYVYNQSTENKPLIPYEMQPYNKLVYYVAYGSNMLEERFMKYIKGCTNKNEPITSIPVKIPFNMYYSEESTRWNHSAVCFLDYTKSGFAYGRAYLVTEEQFKEIQIQECGGCKVTPQSWYGKIVGLDDLNGFQSKTFTSQAILEHKSIEQVDARYLRVLIEGLKETYGLSDKEALEYLEKCGE